MCIRDSWSTTSSSATSGRSGSRWSCSRSRFGSSRSSDGMRDTRSPAPQQRRSSGPADRVAAVPEPHDLAGRVTRSAKKLARKGLEKAPGAARLARTSYFAALNWSATQRIAYRAWLRMRAREANQRTRPVGGSSPTVSVVLDVAGQVPAAAERAVARVLAQTYENWDLTVTSNTLATPHVPRSRRHRLVLLEGSTLACLLYTSDAADDLPCVDSGGRRIVK